MKKGKASMNKNAVFAICECHGEVGNTTITVLLLLLLLLRLQRLQCCCCFCFDALLLPAARLYLISVC